MQVMTFCKHFIYTNTICFVQHRKIIFRSPLLLFVPTVDNIEDLNDISVRHNTGVISVSFFPLITIMLENINQMCPLPKQFD